MKPSQVASKLRQIAVAIGNSKSPRPDLVVADLRRLAGVMEEEIDYLEMNTPPGEESYPSENEPTDEQWYHLIESGKDIEFFREWLKKHPDNLDHLFTLVLMAVKDGEEVPKEVRELALRGTTGGVKPSQIILKLRQIAAATRSARGGTRTRTPIKSSGF